MAKNIEITRDIAEKIRLSVDDPEFDVGQVAVFEAVAVNTYPVNKRNSIYDGSRITRSTLVQMETMLASGESVPLHTLHNQGYELPVGRVFTGQVFDLPDGESELRALFYVDKSHESLISSLLSSTIDEVSIAALPEKLLCSECGWDYMGEDATFEHIWDRTCENGHEVGVNGVHTRFAGLAQWAELSLVSKGAAKRPKIVSRAKSKLSDDQRQRLAASGIQPEVVMLIANMKDHSMMELTALVTELTDLKATKALWDQERENLNSQVAALQAQLDAHPKDYFTVEALEAALGSTDLEGIKARLEAKDISIDFLVKNTKAAMVALGQDPETVSNDPDEMIKVIEAAQVKLHQLIPDGAVSEEAVSDSECINTAKLDAFKAPTRIRK